LCSRKVGEVQHPGRSEYEQETGAPVRRSLYISEVLYTVSENLVKMNNLSDMRELNQVRLR